MSLPPITIPALSAAGPIDYLNDLLLIRQGLNDRKVTVGQIANPRLGSMSLLSGQVVASDLLLVARDNGTGYENYTIPPQYLGFLNGTVAWFWQASAPLGWSVVPNSGDKVLATALPGGASYQYNAFGYQGDWQQQDHTLTIAQMPSHDHSIQKSSANSSSLSTNYLRAGDSSGNIGFATTNSTGSTEGHNHGNEWRPSAAVGILCVKDKLIGE